MPWRETTDPYEILVSEIMLQQTQVARALPKYDEFLKTFPTIESLAKATDKKLLKVWAGLGYWRRALYLRECARKIIKDYQGAFPQKPKELETLPGIGYYTARAIACFAFGNTETFLDTNIRRVFLHFFFTGRDNTSYSHPSRKKTITTVFSSTEPPPRQSSLSLKISDKDIFPIAQKSVYTKNPREWHYALFDYGAIALKHTNINKQSKHYSKQKQFDGSFRFFRTKVVHYLLEKPRSRASSKELTKMLTQELKNKNKSYQPTAILSALVNDQLIKKHNTTYFL